MESDWEVEIGGDAPVIEAHWEGFVDLSMHPERIGEISETATFPPLADLLLALNSPPSPVWTSKCDLWAPAPNQLACFVDVLPRDGTLFTEWPHAETFSRALTKSLAPNTTLAEQIESGRHADPKISMEPESEATILLVVRRAVASEFEGFGITAYFSAHAPDAFRAQSVLAECMVAFSSAIQTVASPQRPDQS